MPEFADTPSLKKSQTNLGLLAARIRIWPKSPKYPKSANLPAHVFCLKRFLNLSRPWKIVEPMSRFKMRQDLASIRYSGQSCLPCSLLGRAGCVSIIENAMVAAKLVGMTCLVPPMTAVRSAGCRFMLPASRSLQTHSKSPCREPWCKLHRTVARRGLR